MNLILSRALFFLPLVLCCTSTEYDRWKNILSSGEKAATIPDQITEIVPTTATQMPTSSKPNHTEIAVLVVRKTRRFSTSDVCGGILVSPRIVITAAHCFYDTHGLYRRFPNMFRVVHGEEAVYRNGPLKGPPAELVVAHPRYIQNRRINDIGAIRLKKELLEGSTMIARQSLPLVQIWNTDAKLEMLVFSVENETLKTVTTERMAARFSNKYTCYDLYQKWGVRISSKQLCIDQVDPKFYHSGESAILLLNDQPIGVLSFKLDVTSINSLPYVYTDLSRYWEFIQKEIQTDAALRLKPFKIFSSILYVVFSRGLLK